MERTTPEDRQAIIKATDEVAEELELSREEFMAVHMTEHCQQIHELQVAVGQILVVLQQGPSADPMTITDDKETVH